MSGRGEGVHRACGARRARLRLPGSDRATFLISDRAGLVDEAPGGSIVALPARRSASSGGQGERGEASVALEKGVTRAVESFAPMEADRVKRLAFRSARGRRRPGGVARDRCNPL